MGMYFVDVHTHNGDCVDGVLKILNRTPHDEIIDLQSSSVGIHPWDTANAIDLAKSKEWLLQVAALPNVVAVGECGLDKIRGGNFLVQKGLFEAHVAVSEKFNKPLIIHCVRAYNEIISLKKALKPSLPWVLHGFAGSVQLIQQCVDAGFYFSMSSKNIDRFCKTVVNVPLERLFFESDDDPSVPVEQTYLAASEVLAIDVATLKAIVRGNVETVFGALVLIE